MKGIMMSRKRVICIAMGLGILVGSWFAFTSWVLRPKVVQAQCTQLYLDSAVGAPTCPGGTRISYTQGSTSPSYHLALCIQ